MACTSRRRVTVLVSRVTSCFSIPCSFTSTIRSRTHTRSYHFGSQQLVRQHYDSHTVLATRAYPGYCSSHSCKCRSKLVSSLTSFDCNSNRKFKSSCKSTCNYNFTRRISSSTTTRAHEEVWAGMNSSTRELAKGLLECKRSALAKSITLIESTRLDHQHQSELLMEYLADRTMDQKKLRMGTSFRIGVAGPPGTFCISY